MGMFDTFVVVDGLKCAHGHVLSEFQTKDLDCSMSSYYVLNGQLYRFSEDDEGYDHHSYKLDGENLVVEHLNRKVFLPFLYTGSVVVYSDCHQCQPVLYETSSTLWGHVAEKTPWLEYDLVFEKGKLVETKPIRVESREDLRASVVGAIPDDDRIAVRHFKLREEGHGRRFGRRR